MTTWCFKWPILCISYRIKSRHFYWTEGNQVSCWFSSCSQVRVISRNRRVWPESGYRLIWTPIGDICPIKWEGPDGFSGFSRLWNEEWLHLWEKSTILAQNKSEYTTPRSAIEQPINFVDVLVLLKSQHEPGAMWGPIKNARPAKPAHLDVTHLHLGAKHLINLQPVIEGKHFQNHYSQDASGIKHIIQSFVVYIYPANKSVNIIVKMIVRLNRLNKAWKLLKC